MARRNQQTFAKRQREQKRAEKARQKLAKRALRNDPEAPPAEPMELDPLAIIDEPDDEVSDEASE